MSSENDAEKKRAAAAPNAALPPAPDESAPDESARHAEVRDTEVNPARFLGMTTGIGVFFVTMVLLFAGAGWLANRYLGTGGWGMAIAITLGAVAGMYASYLRVGKMLTVLYPENKK
ncbi:hypothetical protein AGMMS49959_12970 [Planctomycetales bacterium]|nr:hypothetical protein AGMMS49959_12970 [Planctomycetales bacterium]